jgi:hypothetical protein
MENKNPVEHNTMINDIREPTHFKGVTFSEYKKIEVKKQMINNMLKGKIEPACYWCAELICAGHFMEVWETILYFVGKYIHIGNPKIVIYLEMRYNLFRNIIQQGHFLNELQLRNNKTIRDLFAEIVFVLTMSTKKHSFEAVKINRVEEFDITQMQERLKATSMKYIENIVDKEDPKELYIAINEFGYHISNDSNSMLLACYWIEWLIEFDLICKKRKEPCYCKRRNYNVDRTCQRDNIWIIWDILIHTCAERKNDFLIKVMNAIMNLFCIKYTTASCKKRRYMLYFAVSLLTEPLQQVPEAFQNKELLKNVIGKIGEVYKQIKKNEHSPNTEYLFSNLETKNNFEESVKKIEMMNNMDFLPRS